MMATIDPQWIVQLKGKAYPQWPGILDAAMKAGLRSLTTDLIQAPDKENGGLAIVSATATFEDGRIFTDLGDASPANCSAQIATAAVRMASTRAKGRCLRDALSIGQTMFEELPDNEPAERSTPRPTDMAVKHAPVCQIDGCDRVLSANQVFLCQKHSEELEGLLLCPEHLHEAARAIKEQRTAAQ